MRPVGITLCSFGLMGTIGFLLFSYFGSFAAQSEGEIMLARILATAGIAAFLWKMIILNGQKNFLETSDDGIRIIDTITKYIPWDNIKNIAIEEATPPPDPDAEDYSPFLKPRVTPVIYLELHNADDILFERNVYKFSARKVDKFIKELKADENRINLDILITVHSQKEICEMLRARWNQAMSDESTSN